MQLFRFRSSISRILHVARRTGCSKAKKPESGRSVVRLAADLRAWYAQGSYQSLSGSEPHGNTCQHTFGRAPMVRLLSSRIRNPSSYCGVILKRGPVLLLAASTRNIHHHGVTRADVCVLRTCAYRTQEVIVGRKDALWWCCSGVYFVDGGNCPARLFSLVGCQAPCRTRSDLVETGGGTVGEGSGRAVGPQCGLAQPATASSNRARASQHGQASYRSVPHKTCTKGNRTGIRPAVVEGGKESCQLEISTSGHRGRCWPAKPVGD